MTEEQFIAAKKALEERDCRELERVSKEEPFVLQVETFSSPYILPHYFQCRDIHHLKEMTQYLLTNTPAYEVVTYAPGKNPLTWFGNSWSGYLEHEWSWYYGHLEKVKTLPLDEKIAAASEQRVKAQTGTDEYKEPGLAKSSPSQDRTL